MARSKGKYSISCDEELMKEFDKFLEDTTGTKRSTWIERKIREALEEKKKEKVGDAD